MTLIIDKENVAVAQLQAEHVGACSEDGQDSGSVCQFWMALQHLLSLPSLHCHYTGPFRGCERPHVDVALNSDAPALREFLGDCGSHRLRNVSLVLRKVLQNFHGGLD